MTSENVYLPNGWAWSRVGEIGDYLNGRGFKKSEWRETGRPIIRIQNLTGSNASFNYYEGDADERHTVRAGDLLVSWAATLGVFVWCGPEAVLNQHIFKVQSHINPTFHRWELEHLLDTLYGSAHGSGMVHVTRGAFEAVQLAVPPLPEQERIVAAIEEHLSRLDAAEAALSLILRKLDLMLRATLATACSGDWPRKPLAEIATSVRNGVFVSRPAAEPPGLRIYRISAVRPLNLRVDDVRYATPEPTGAKFYAVEAGDLLFTRYSGNPDYVGAVAVVPPAGAGILHPDKLIRVVADRDQALPDWIAAYVTAGEGRSEIEKRLKTTAGQVGIAGSQLKTVPIPVPPIDHQAEMVAMIAAVRTEQERLAAEVHSAANHAKALRRSILAAAFSGQLVAQDRSDEPADVLLERIAEERPSAATKRRAPAKSSTKVKVSPS